MFAVLLGNASDCHRWDGRSLGKLGGLMDGCSGSKNAATALSSIAYRSLDYFIYNWPHQQLSVDERDFKDACRTVEGTQSENGLTDVRPLVPFRGIYCISAQGKIPFPKI